MVPVCYRSFTPITTHELASMPDTRGRQNPRHLRTVKTKTAKTVHWLFLGGRGFTSL